MRRGTKFSITVIALVFAVCGWFFPDIAAVYLSKSVGEESVYRNSMNWPVTSGIVTKCESEHRACLPWEQANYGQISYTYRIGAQSYSNGNIRSGYILAGSEECLPDYERSPEYVSSHYPVGKRVTVHYNANNPQAAYLETAISDQQLQVGHAFGILGVIMLLCLGWVIVFDRQSSSRYNPLVEPRISQDKSTKARW